MAWNETICALVPMRHSSERVEGKNYRIFGGRPLFHHILESLLTCGRDLRVIVDTDSGTIREQIRGSFPMVEVFERPEHLRSGETPMTEVLRHDAGQVDQRLLLQTHSTNPLLRPETIAAAIDRYVDNRGEHDTLFGVTRWQTRLYDARARPLNHDPAVLLRTQDLPPIYEENSNLYIFPRALILERGVRIGHRPLMFEIDPREAMDIDDEAGFTIAEAMYRIRQGGP